MVHRHPIFRRCIIIHDAGFGTFPKQLMVVLLSDVLHA